MVISVAVQFVSRKSRIDQERGWPAHQQDAVGKNVEAKQNSPHRLDRSVPVKVVDVGVDPSETIPTEFSLCRLSVSPFYGINISLITQIVWEAKT